MTADDRAALDIADMLLPGLPHRLIVSRYAAAPGNEIASGKFRSPESSSCLVANAFGLFFDNPAIMPALPGLEQYGDALTVTPEVILRFPWRGGRHPCLDLVIETHAALIGVESKRYEPFRPKAEVELSEAYQRPVWGARMSRHLRLLDGLLDGTVSFSKVDAAQLVKHAFGLRTAVHRDDASARQPVLVYLYAEPKQWPDGRPIADEEIENHRTEIERFAAAVEGDEVAFHACSYPALLAAWRGMARPSVREHAAAILGRFDVVRIA